MLEEHPAVVAVLVGGEFDRSGDAEGPGSHEDEPTVGAE
jgi:hypothetical protein